MKSIVKVGNIWATDLFEWFYTHVMNAGGDGGGTIVCKNYKEVADWFEEWHEKKYPEFHKWFHVRHESDNDISFQDANESFSFTDNEPKFEFAGDYIFIVEKDCPFDLFGKRDDRKIIGINGSVCNENN